MYGREGRKLEINIPPQQIYANSMGVLIIEGGVMSSEYDMRLTHMNVWESMGKTYSCMQFIKSRIFTTSHHARIRIRYCKSWALRLNVQ